MMLCLLNGFISIGFYVDRFALQAWLTVADCDLFYIDSAWLEIAVFIALCVLFYRLFTWLFKEA